MRVRAARPKRIHTTPARATICNPRTLPLKQLHRPRRPIDMRRRLLTMQRPRQHTVLKRLHHLDHTSHTRRRLRMTNIRLDRTQIKRHTLTILPIRRNNRLRLDRITQTRPRTMSLNRINIPRRQTGTRQRLTNNPLLRRPIRSRQPITSTILIHRRPTNKRQHTMTPTTRIRQPLQHNKTHTLREPAPIRTRRKRLTTPVNSQTTLTRKLDENPGCGEYRHSSRHRQTALAGTQRLTSEMDRHQRRGARSVDRHCGALQAKRISHAPRENTACHTRSEVALQFCRQGTSRHAIVGVHDPCKYAGLATPQSQWVDAGIFKSLPRSFQDLALLRVHRQRLLRSNGEERRIKL